MGKHIMILTALTLAGVFLTAPSAEAQVRIVIGIGGGGGYYGGYPRSGFYPLAAPYAVRPGYAPARVVYYSPVMPATFAQPASFFAPAPAPLTQGGPQSASIRVLVPDPLAQVWFDGVLTKQTGTDRRFHTPALAPGTYTYRVRAAWLEEDEEMIQELVVTVTPGQTSLADFRPRPAP